MANYGIAVSADGYDVKTCADKNMVITSKYSNLKGSISGSGTISVPQTGTWTTKTIAHGLNYIPMAQGYAKDRDGDYFSAYYYEMPVYDYTAGTEIIWQIRANSTNVELRFWYDDYGYGGANVDVEYKYFIFIDKGKL